MADTDVMATSLFVNEDWSALVPAGSLEARFGITPKDAKRLGLLPLGDGETLGEPERLTSANVVPTPALEAVAVDDSTVDEPAIVAAVEDEPEVKAAGKVANKSADKPDNKGAARKDDLDGDGN